MKPIQRGRNLLQQVRTGTQNVLARTQKAASAVAAARPAVAKGAQAGRFVDGFQSQAAGRGQAVQGRSAGAKSDRVYDGHLVGAGGRTFPPGTPLRDIPGVTPRGNPNPSKTFLYVNGISNTKDQQFQSMQQVADRTGAKVIGVHNATEGMVADLAQCVKDKLGKGNNPAVTSLADTVYAELKAGRSVHLVGHSQGGLITSRALKDVSNRLRVEDGLSRAATEKLLGKVNVETFGAAAGTYPNGPKYVHYVNTRDPVPTLFGQGNGKGADEFLRSAGRGAVVHRFEHGKGMSGTHGLADAYLPYRVPFEQARAGKFQ
jgi:hypothetical protein